MNAERKGRPAKPADESTYSGRMAARLKQLREKRFASQEAFAIALTEAGHPTATRAVSDWETGKNKLPWDALPIFAAVLGCSIRSLLPGK